MSTPAKIEELLKAPLKVAIDACIADPTLLHRPELGFLKTFIEQYSEKVKSTPATEAKPEPKAAPSEPKPEPKQEPEPEPEPEPESEESDLELDTTGVIEPDNDAPQKMGDCTSQPTEEDIAESQKKRSEALLASTEKDYDKAIELYTEAIILNPVSSLLHSKRAQIYLLQQKPNACIRDCNCALELNPDNAAAYKCRGRANHLLGKWQEAAADLRIACQLDFDEEADKWLREVTPNARKLEERKRKDQRKAEMKQERDKQEKKKKAGQAAKDGEPKTGTTQPEQDGDTASKMGNFYQFLTDFDLLQAFLEPEITEAFRDISMNPTNVLKYQNNPKVMSLINQMASKFGGASNVPTDFSNMMGGLMGGMRGFPGAPPGATPEAANTPTPPKPADDVDID